VADAGAREQRRRLLSARLVVYFVLALWLFRGRNCGYGQVMVKLADGLYYQRRGRDLLAGQLDPDGWVGAGQGRRWPLPSRSRTPNSIFTARSCSSSGYFLRAAIRPHPSRFGGLQTLRGDPNLNRTYVPCLTKA